MNFFTKTKTMKTIAIILTFLTIFNFIYPTSVVHAASLGDMLLNAVQNAFNWITDHLLKPMLEGVMGFLVKLVIDGVVSLLDSLVDGVAVIINNLFVEPGEKAVVGNNSIKIKLTPENIILGKFALLNGNIFHKFTTAEAGAYFDISDSADDNMLDAKDKLRTNVAKWYYALRNFSIVALLSVLVYVAIRMVISTLSNDKAKYKLMLKDWLVALCLVIFMHYIMITLLETSTLITKAVGGNGSDIVNTIRQNIDSGITGKNPDGTDDPNVKGLSEYGNISDDGYMDKLGEVFSNIFIYIAIIVFTIIFVVKYLIRAITLMFLAIIRTGYSSYISNR